MRKHNAIRVVLITILVIALLSWLLPAATFQDNKLALAGRTQIGLFDLSIYPFTVIQYFGYIVFFILAVGGFYGILYKIPAYRAMLDKIAYNLRGNEKLFVVVTTVVFAFLTSVCGVQLALFIFFPFIASVILLLGYDKMVVALTLVGSTIVGLMGTTMAYSNIEVLFSVLKGVDIKTALPLRIAILLVGLFALIIEILCYIKKHSVVEARVAAKRVVSTVKNEVKNEVKNVKTSKAKTKTNKNNKGKKTTKSSSRNNKADLVDEAVVAVKEDVDVLANDYIPKPVRGNYKVWPLVASMAVVFIILVLAFMPWTNAFNVKLFSELQTKFITNAEIKVHIWLAMLIGLSFVVGLVNSKDKRTPIPFINAFIAMFAGCLAYSAAKGVGLLVFEIIVAALILALTIVLVIKSSNKLVPAIEGSLATLCMISCILVTVGLKVRLLVSIILAIMLIAGIVYTCVVGGKKPILAVLYSALAVLAAYLVTNGNATGFMLLLLVVGLTVLIARKLTDNCAIVASAALVVAIVYALIFAAATGFGVFFKEFGTFFGEGFAIFRKVFGNATEFGTWTLEPLTAVLVVTALFLVWAYRIKVVDALDGVRAGLKKAIGPALVTVLLYTILVMVTYQPFQLYLYEAILGWAKSFNIFTSALIAALAAFFNVDSYYAFANVLPYYTTIIKDASVYPKVAVLFQAVYALTMLVAPTSLILMTVLSFLKVNYKDWLKTVWVFAVAVLLLVLLILSIWNNIVAFVIAALLFVLLIALVIANKI